MRVEHCRPDMSDFQTQQASLSQSQALAAAIQRAKQVRRSSRTAETEKKAVRSDRKNNYCYSSRLPRRFNQVSSSNHKEAAEATALAPQLAEEEVTISSDTPTTATAGPTVNAPLAVPTTVRITRT